MRRPLAEPFALAAVLGLAVMAAAPAAAVDGQQDAMAVSPRRLLEVVDFSPPVVSPDGRRVAFRAEQASVERNTWDTVWYVQDMDGDRVARRVADGGVPLRDSAGETLPATAIWSPDGEWIHYRPMYAAST